MYTNKYINTTPTNECNKNTKLNYLLLLKGDVNTEMNTIQRVVA